MANTVKLIKREEIRTENPAEINNKVIKTEINAIIPRNMLKQYQTFCNIFFEVILDENNEEN
jgi:hypothetical protein